MVCAGCGYRPWPCASCGVPRCMCRAGDIYQHHYPAKPAEPVVLPPSIFPCGHPKVDWNVMRFGDGSRLRDGYRVYCRECHNQRMRDYRRQRRERQEGRWRAESVPGEQLAEDYLRAQ